MVGVGGSLVGAVAAHSGEAQGDTTGVARSDACTPSRAISTTRSGRTWTMYPCSVPTSIACSASVCQRSRSSVSPLYFQAPGRAEAEIEADVARWLEGFYFSASGDAPPMVVGQRLDGHHPRRCADAGPVLLPPVPTGVARPRGPGVLRRRVRADRVQRRPEPLPQRRPRLEDFATFSGRVIDVPALFVGGAKDGPTLWGARAIERFKETLPHLHRSIVLDGCGHWTQQERPAEVNAALVEFLAALGSPDRRSWTGEAAPPDLPRPRRRHRAGWLAGVAGPGGRPAGGGAVRGRGLAGVAVPARVRPRRGGVVGRGPVGGRPRAT